MAEAILDVDLLRFERGDCRAKEAVVDGVRRSLAWGFVFASSDLSENLLDEAYGHLGRFFALGTSAKRSCIAAGSHGQSGYTGPLVETAAGIASSSTDFLETMTTLKVGCRVCLIEHLFLVRSCTIVQWTN
jgi:isopenicillin N synthase-like dioxygenase